MRFKLLLFFSFLSVASSASSEERVDDFSLVPEIHGVLRTRYEMETADCEGRFQVRNARVSLTGKVAPVISYYVQVDACDRGKMKFLDAWGRFDLSKEFIFQAGQFREPFGVDNFRGPGSYYFANRSFIGKTICNVRGVGAKFGYFSKKIPLTAEAGMFNSESIADHEVWSKKPAFASKVSYGIGGFTFVTGFQSLRPYDTRMNLIDGAVTWKNSGWIVEGEYMYTHYTNESADACHAYNVFTSKSFPVKAGIFNMASVEARFDGHTAHSDGSAGDDGLLRYTSPSRNRITVGGTLTYKYKSVHADIRLNYEKYMYHHDVNAQQGAGDKIVAELIVKF